MEGAASRCGCQRELPIRGWRRWWRWRWRRLGQIWRKWRDAVVPILCARAEAPWNSGVAASLEADETCCAVAVRVAVTLTVAERYGWSHPMVGQ